MFCWIWNLKNCMLQSESLSTILAGGVQDAIAKNVSVVWGMEGASKRFLLADLSLCKCILCCVLLLFLHLWILGSREALCVYIAFLRRFFFFFGYFWWLLSECLFGFPSGFILNQKVRNCPWLLALLGSVPKQHEGVSHWAEWKWEVRELDMTVLCAGTDFCMS